VTQRPGWWPLDPDRPREPIAVRVYRAAVRLAPREFRVADGEGVAHLFAEVHAEHVRRFGVLGGVVALVVELPGLVRMLTAAWRERRWFRARATVSLHRKATMLDSLAQDVRAALRFVRTAPAIATIAVLTLALGVGANTAMFSLVHGVLLKPLAMPRAEQLVALGESRPNAPPGTLNSTSIASYLQWKASATAASGMTAYSFRFVSITGFGEPEAVISIPNVGGLLDVAGVRPLFGRTILPSDEQPDAQPVAVLSHQLWQRLFGEDRNVIGRALSVNGSPVNIVGVMPPRFSFPYRDVGLWEPMRWTPQERANRDQYFLSVAARLRDGATMDQFRAQLAGAAQALRREWGQYNTDLVINAVPMRESIVGSSRTQLLLLMGAVVCVLLITCANLANLLLARATARQHEVAVRRALGARAVRIVRQLLAESLLLAIAGGVAAIGVGKVLMKFFLSALSDSLPRSDEVALNSTVLAFTLAVAVVSGVAFGLAPALQLTRGQAVDALREGARTSSGRKTGRQVLVVLQLALALVLLTGAGLLFRSFAYLGSVNPGFDPRNLLTLRFTVPNNRPDFLPTVLQRIGALPGVTAAAATSQLPATGRGNGAWFNMYSRPVPAGQTPPGEAYRVITPSYFETARIGLVRGRLIGEGDGLGGTPSVVVNEALARKYFPDRDAVGEEIYLGAPDNKLFERATIVGVVGSTRDGGLGAEPIPVVYGTTTLMPWWRPFQLMVRTEGPPMSALPAVRREIRSLAPDLVLRNVETMETTLRDSLASNRWSLILIAAFAAVALIMSSLGVFGVLSYLVAQRTRELGIRIALGAAPRQLRRMVVGQGLRLAAIGVFLGLVGAYALNGTIRTMLFGVRGTDPLTYAAVAVVLVAVGVLASWIPARRSTRVDPVKALREG
jgi:putative ABC transport system permease protein